MELFSDLKGKRVLNTPTNERRRGGGEAKALVGDLYFFFLWQP